MSGSYWSEYTETDGRLKCSLSEEGGSIIRSGRSFFEGWAAVGGDLGLSVAPPYWYCCRYNYLKDEWEETPSMPRSRSHVTAFVKDNAGYVCFDDIVYKFVP